MNEGPSFNRIDVNAAMRELIETQRRIDEAAKGIVDRTKRLIDVRENLVPGANETYERLFGDWYRAMDRDLAAAGFQSFGPYRNLNAPPETPPEKAAYYHLGLSADRTIAAAWFLVASKLPKPRLVLESVSTDGAAVVTTSGRFGERIPGILESFTNARRLSFNLGNLAMKPDKPRAVRSSIRCHRG